MPIPGAAGLLRLAFNILPTKAANLIDLPPAPAGHDPPAFAVSDQWPRCPDKEHNRVFTRRPDSLR